MTQRKFTGWPRVLHGIAAGLFWTQLAIAQGAAPDAGEEGDCTPSPEPHECAERCPRFDTCYVEDDAQLYYRVNEERFDCEGLDCVAASTELGDYCCERGEYAPSRGGGGGCSLVPPADFEPEPGSGGVLLGAWSGAFGLLVVSRYARSRRARHGA